MNPIETKLNGHALMAINKVWGHFVFQKTISGKCEQSILEQVAARFMKKQIARVGKNQAKEFTLSLQFFEVVPLERQLRNIVDQLPPTSHEKAAILLFKNQLHQQIP